MRFKSYILFFLITAFCVSFMASCDDDDTFSSDPSHVLSFEKSTLCLDTVFANTMSAYKMIKIYNNSGDGLKISSVRQSKGTNTSGFYVNINGSYLDPEQNCQLSDLEVRQGDSLRVFVELKPLTMVDTDTLKEVNDQIVFTFESGTQQTLNLTGWSWNAKKLVNYHVKAGNDTILTKGLPIVVYGMLTVDSTAMLKITEGARLYFHQDGGIKVYGGLKVEGKKGNEVIMQCDRLDSLLQVRYDNVPGKWKGITFSSSSGNYINSINYLDLHGSSYGIVCDSSVINLQHSTIHNILGPGILSHNSTLFIENCQLTNARDYCLHCIGGDIDVNATTLASFFAYSTGRKYALLITDKDSLGNETPLNFVMKNSIATGYENDEIYYVPFSNDSTKSTIKLMNCLFRTPVSKDTVLMYNCIFEDIDDENQGKGGFVLFDTHNFKYDFTPKSTYPAVGLADPATVPSDDRRGNIRKAKPDAGCYETFPTEEGSNGVKCSNSSSGFK